MEGNVRVKRFLTAICLASGLLVSPIGAGHNGLGIGADPVLAEEPCKLEIEICQEFNVGFYKWETCWTFRFFCD